MPLTSYGKALLRRAWAQDQIEHIRLDADQLPLFDEDKPRFDALQRMIQETDAVVRPLLNSYVPDAPPLAQSFRFYLNEITTREILYDAETGEEANALRLKVLRHAEAHRPINYVPGQIDSFYNVTATTPVPVENPRLHQTLVFEE